MCADEHHGSNMLNAMRPSHSSINNRHPYRLILPHRSNKLVSLCFYICEVLILDWSWKNDAFETEGSMVDSCTGLVTRGSSPWSCLGSGLKLYHIWITILASVSLLIVVKKCPCLLWVFIHVSFMSQMTEPMSVHMMNQWHGISFLLLSFDYSLVTIGSMSLWVMRFT